jgi:anti-anti-sigma regulatory factor
MLTLRRKVSDTHPIIPLSGVTPYARKELRPSSRVQAPSRPGMVVSAVQVQGRVPVTILHPDAALNAASHLDLVAKAREVYQVGTRDVVLDMRDVPAISSSGLAALYSAAVVLRGEEPPDPEAGWATFHTMARELESGSQQPHFKLLGPQPKVKQALEQVGFENFLEIHDDLERAVASF